MEQELKNKYPAEFDEISDKYSCYIGDSLSDFEMVSGRSVILPNDIKPMLHSAYTLAKSEYAERIKELEAAINYALPLLTNTPPQHRKEFHSTARAALKKALNPKP